MNRKLEDAMVRLAFGDVTPEEVVALEREAAKNPDAASALAGYRRMREGLRDLYEVPQEQLSKERLRDAILASGLKPQPNPGQRNWLWMPAAAAALVFGLMMVKQAGHNGSTTIVGGSDSVAMNRLGPKSEPDFRPFESAGTFVKPATDRSHEVAVGTSHMTGTAAALRTAGQTSAHRRRGSRVHRETVGVDSLSNTLVMIPNTADGDNVPPDRRAIVNTASADMSSVTAPETAPASQPIVLIEGSKDNDTGAQKATEVDSSKNVRTSG